MWRVLVGFLTIQIMVYEVSSKPIEMVNSVEESVEPVEIPIKIGPRKSTNNGFSIFNQVDDPFFSFMGRMANISYLSSQIALNRLKNHSDKIKEFGEGIEDLIEKLPSFPIPILDDMSHAKLLA